MFVLDHATLLIGSAKTNVRWVLPGYQEQFPERDRY